MRGPRFLVALCVFSTAMIAADNPFIGSWKLNTAKSKFTPGTATKEMAITFTADGDKITRVATGIDSDGEPVNEKSSIAWDGNDHPIDVPPGITVAVKPVNDRTLDVTIKRKGTVVSSIHVAVAKNGKTFTSQEKGEDPKGRQINNVEVFERQ
jgi:hypothetical protein